MVRKLTKISAKALIIGLAAVATAHAGNGRSFGGQGNSMAQQPTVLTEACQAPTSTISGTVADAGAYSGTGMLIDLGEEVVSVYGAGPYRYWEGLDIARPTVGDQVEIETVQIDFSDGTQKNIAITISIGDDYVELRDLETCQPLWRNYQNNTMSANSLDLSKLLARNGKGGPKGQGQGQGKGGSNGPGDGSGNNGTGPKDCTGNGSKTGDCLNG